MMDKYNPEEIALIVGLGNPSDELAQTYHNVGMQALNSFIDGAAFTPASTGTFAYTRVGAHTFIQPKIFMNESGVAVRDALHYFKASPSQLLVIHDDADVPLGEYRLQFGRGEAGHHGVASIIRTIHTHEFWRLRIGIEQKVPLIGTRKRAETFVLKAVSRAHKHIFIRLFEEIRTLLSL